MACLARLDGKVTRETVERAIGALVNLEHRGAEGADPSTGDGAGILMQIPDAFMRAEVHPDLPPAGHYGIAFCFLPQEPGRARRSRSCSRRIAREEGLEPITWRDVPVEPCEAGERSREVAPTMRQLFMDAGSLEGDDLERKLYVVRRRAENESGGDLYLPSCSSRTIVYKGMLSAPQLARYYPDLADERLASALAIVHSRFSTNTFPSWSLAHPFHMSAHNGEFNTLLGNVSWMRAREARLAAGPLGDDVGRTLPAIPVGSSDSAAFDAVLELLVRGGRTLEHSVMLMTPEAHEGRPDMPGPLSDFYDYGSMLMEPWDGPASVTFTDGKILGATLDRNGLRPGRWVVTRDGWFALASEAGAFHVPSEDVERVGRLLPGRLLVVDPERGGLLEDRQAELDVAADRPYGAWFAEHSLGIDDLPSGAPAGASRAHARAAPAGLRLDPGGRARGAGPDGGRRRGRGLDGQRRRPGRHLRAPAAAVHLLQAAVRPGDQPGHRPGAREDRDEPAHGDRPRGRPVRGDARAGPPAGARAPGDRGRGRWTASARSRAVR